MPRRALVGNWFEEEAYERDRKRLMRGAQGGMVSASTELAQMLAKKKHHETPHALAPVADDGFLRFYAPVMLQNAHTIKFLSIDLDDRRHTTTGWRVTCSTASADEATSRSTWVLVPSPVAQTDSFPIPADEADVVHYGQPFYIMSVPELCPDALSLMSEFRSPDSASKVTGKYQEVFFSPDGGSAAAMWCADYANPDYQEDERGHPIGADDVLFLRHNMTNAPLASDSATFLNDFGNEHEVGCGRLLTYASRRKAGGHRAENFWMFIHSGQGVSEAGITKRMEATASSSAE